MDVSDSSRLAVELALRSSDASVNTIDVVHAYELPSARGLAASEHSRYRDEERLEGGLP